MSKQIIAGGVAIGGGAPVTIQSMCNTHTEDAKATIEALGSTRSKRRAARSCASRCRIWRPRTR